MKNLSHWSRAGAFIWLVATSPSCTSTDSQRQVPLPPPSGASAMGKLSVHLVDAPADVAQVWINVADISVKTCAGTWSSPPIIPTVVDLLTLTGGAAAPLVAGAGLPADSYCELRLILADQGNKVVFKDSSEEPLKTPSGQSAGVKFKGEFYTAPGIETFLTLDFDVDQSLVANKHGTRFNLKPVIRLAAVEYRSDDGAPVPHGKFLGAEAASIDASGGTVTLADGAQVTFPAGAVQGAYAFTATRWRTDALGVMSDVYGFLPPMKFEKPVVFTLPYDPAKALSPNFFAFHDNNMAEVSFGPTEATVQLEHFTHVYVASKPATMTTLTPGDKEAYALPDHACVHPVARKASCQAGVYDPDTKKIEAVISCPDVSPFMPGCTEFHYDDIDSSHGAVRVDFFLTDEEIHRILTDDATIEWQLKFFKQKIPFLPHSAVKNWTSLTTNLPGTVLDSPCADQWTSQNEESLAAVTLCPGDLIPGFKYSITFGFEKDSVVFGDLAKYTIPRSFAFDVVPSRVCETFDKDTNGNLAHVTSVWQACGVPSSMTISRQRRSIGAPATTHWPSPTATSPGTATTPSDVSWIRLSEIMSATSYRCRSTRLRWSCWPTTRPSTIGLTLIRRTTGSSPHMRAATLRSPPSIARIPR
jgi:hypothetical protein